SRIRLGVQLVIVDHVRDMARTSPPAAKQKAATLVLPPSAPAQFFHHVQPKRPTEMEPLNHRAPPCNRWRSEVRAGLRDKGRCPAPDARCARGADDASRHDLQR